MRRRRSLAGKLRPSRPLDLAPRVVDVLDVDEELVFVVILPRRAIEEAVEALR